jgi:hypothetical protein
VCLGLVSVLYWRTPNDLIPDRIPMWGRVDDVGVILMCVGLTLYLLREGPAIPASARDGARRVAVAAVCYLTCPLLHRLAVGVWPTRQSAARFRRGMSRGNAPVSPLLRGVATTPEARPQLRVLLTLDYLAGLPGDGPLTPEPVLPAPYALPPHFGDPLRVWTGPRLGVLHFEKAAGTSLVDALVPQFHPVQIDPDPLRSMPPHLICRTTAGMISACRDHALVWGHYDLPYLRALGADRVPIVLLREPAARLLSLYHYWRSLDAEVLAREDGNYTVWLAHRLDLESFLACDDPLLRDYLDNCYVRRLTGTYGDVGEAALAVAAARAREELKHIECVGTTDDLDGFVRALAARFGFTPPPRTPRVNVTAEIARSDRRFRHVPAPAITPEVRRALARLTRHDRVLYEDARRMVTG